ncbi:MAG: hypothetical protein P857_333 [Candidatus Xenolissoclinum pacificiensis L6]|uniref:Uncharacterized protein n=1 Tax=Candidatus Xenolissoclinum pacificiensis L6 TaxID=1401685 RepID=W2V1U2_9RICK|nr:MAG: hypothetical protein P857_333 [Candidatus Xenolissoclinum pacificiensis L6]
MINAPTCRVLQQLLIIIFTLKDKYIQNMFFNINHHHNTN